MNLLYTYKTIPNDGEIININWIIPGLRNNILRSWKKNSDISICVEINISDIERFKNYFHPNSQMAFYLLWHSVQSGKSQGTQIHGCVGKSIFDERNNYKLQGIIPGEKVAGGIIFSVLCCLENEIQEENSIFAVKKGSIIFSAETQTLTLEGDQALFPIKVKSFKDGMANGALYYLEKKFHELDSNFYSSYTLYFNSTNRIFLKLNKEIQDTKGSFADEDKETQYLLKEIMFDVYKTIILDALDNESFVELQTDFSEDSCSLRAIYSNLIGNILESFYDQNETLLSLRQKIHGQGASQEWERNKLFTALQEYIFGGNLNNA